MAEPEPPQLQNSIQLRKKRKKSRYLKQGYHKCERDDFRRVTARAFLSGITRDSHLRAQPLALRPTAPAPEEVRESASSVIAIAPGRHRSSVVEAPSPPSTPVLEARYSPTFRRNAAETDPYPHLGASKSLDQVLDSHSYHQLTGIRTSHSTDYADLPAERPSLFHVAAKWPSTAEGAIYENRLPTPHYYDTGRRSRWVTCTYIHTVEHSSIRTHLNQGHFHSKQKQSQMTHLCAKHPLKRGHLTIYETLNCQKFHCPCLYCSTRTCNI